MSRLQSDPKLLVGTIAGGVLLVLVASWFLLLSPKRDKAVELDQSIASKQAELAAKQAALAQPAAAVKIRASDVFRLNKALPDKTDMTAVILDVNRLAAANKLSFRSLAPAPAIAGTGSIAQPVSVSVQGRFGSVSKFLGDLMSLVRVRDHHMLDARGRTYSITQVELGTPDEADFPTVKATVTINAHSFVPLAPVDPNAAAGTSTTPSTGTVAAGVTP
jgi:Tfp pilus assembly protein PilO